MSKFLINNLSLIIPSRDDDVRIYENIEFIIEYLIKNVEEYEIVVVSNGSTELSMKNVDQLCMQYNNLKHFKLENSGKGLAIKEGMLRSKFDNLLFTDADCSVSISEFSNFVSNNKLKSDFVVGNRKSDKSKNLNSPVLRKISGFLYLSLINLIFELNIEDTQCGFKAIDKSNFKRCKEYETDGYSFDLELFLLAKKENIEITQIPVEYIHNEDSKISIFSDTFKMVWDIFKIYKNSNKYN
jgi:dolichyl-phosphate beta-glucosyltransferase